MKLEPQGPWMPKERICQVFQKFLRSSGNLFWNGRAINVFIRVSQLNHQTNLVFQPFKTVPSRLYMLKAVLLSGGVELPLSVNFKVYINYQSLWKDSNPDVEWYYCSVTRCFHKISLKHKLTLKILFASILLLRIISQKIYTLMSPVTFLKRSANIGVSFWHFDWNVMCCQPDNFFHNLWWHMFNK